MVAALPSSPLLCNCSGRPETTRHVGSRRWSSRLLGVSAFWVTRRCCKSPPLLPCLVAAAACTTTTQGRPPLICPLSLSLIFFSLVSSPTASSKQELAFSISTRHLSLSVYSVLAERKWPFSSLGLGLSLSRSFFLCCLSISLSQFFFTRNKAAFHLSLFWLRLPFYFLPFYSHRGPIKQCQFDTVQPRLPASFSDQNEPCKKNHSYDFYFTCTAGSFCFIAFLVF